MISLRPHTVDRAVYRDIMELNVYRLPDRFEPEDVVIDIGAHTGIFCYACILRGATRIYAFEPEAQNYAFACRNLSRYLGKTVSICRAAVWRSDIDVKELYHSGYEFESGGCNTGSGSVMLGIGASVPSTSFDSIIASIDKPVRLLKIDCEGSEFPILFTSQLLDRIYAIAGEYHEFGGPNNPNLNPAEFTQVSGHPFTKEELGAVLIDQGFSVEILSDRSNPTCGLFFASRR